MNEGVTAATARALRRVTLPLAAYYAVTIAVPVANGATRSGAVFVRHTLVVLIVPPVLVALVCLFRAGSRIRSLSQMRARTRVTRR